MKIKYQGLAASGALALAVLLGVTESRMRKVDVVAGRNAGKSDKRIARKIRLRAISDERSRNLNAPPNDKRASSNSRLNRPSARLNNSKPLNSAPHNSSPGRVANDSVRLNSNVGNKIASVFNRIRNSSVLNSNNVGSKTGSVVSRIRNSSGRNQQRVEELRRQQQFKNQELSAVSKKPRDNDPIVVATIPIARMTRTAIGV